MITWEWVHTWEHTQGTRDFTGHPGDKIWTQTHMPGSGLSTRGSPSSSLTCPEGLSHTQGWVLDFYTQGRGGILWVFVLVSGTLPSMVQLWNVARSLGVFWSSLISPQNSPDASHSQVRKAGEHQKPLQWEKQTRFPATLIL